MCKIGIVVGSANCINKQLTSILTSKYTSICVNRAACDFKCNYATTSESVAFQSWLSLGTKASNFLLTSDLKSVGFNSNATFYNPKRYIKDCINKNDLFYGEGNSALPAIHFLIKQKYDFIILSGITFDSNWRYYYQDYQDSRDATRCEMLKLNLYSLSRYTNIICINQNNFNSEYVSTVDSEVSLINLVKSKMS